MPHWLKCVSNAYIIMNVRFSSKIFGKEIRMEITNYIVRGEEKIKIYQDGKHV